MTVRVWFTWICEFSPDKSVETEGDTAVRVVCSAQAVQCEPSVGLKACPFYVISEPRLVVESIRATLDMF